MNRSNAFELTDPSRYRHEPYWGMQLMARKYAKQDPVAIQRAIRQPVLGAIADGIEWLNDHLGQLMALSYAIWAFNVSDYADRHATAVGLVVLAVLLNLRMHMMHAEHFARSLEREAAFLGGHVQG